MGLIEFRKALISYSQWHIKDSDRLLPKYKSQTLSLGQCSGKAVCVFVCVCVCVLWLEFVGGHG